MTYLLAILTVVMGLGAVVVFWRWRRRARNDDGLGARLSDRWEAGDNDR